MNEEIASIRSDYKKRSLNESEVDNDPIRQFQIWFKEAVNAKIPDVNAMHLSTLSEEGRPAGRIVLLKGLEQNGFQFFTNYSSRKGKELERFHFASLTFFWVELERQVRIEGRVDKLSRQVSENYFESRPRESKIGAWASSQSSVIESREVLDQRFQMFSEKYEGDAIPCPPTWGGYQLIPDFFEFWQGRPGRMHDRITYQFNDESWVIKRLAP